MMIQFGAEDIIDLNERNVIKLFKYCKANNFTPKQNVKECNIFSPKSGRFCPSLSLDMHRVSQKSDAILYLFGQLSSVHQKKFEMSVNAFQYKYDNTKWTENSSVVLILLNLGVASQCIPVFNQSFVKKGSLTTIISENPLLAPTYSPYDHFHK